MTQAEVDAVMGKADARWDTWLTVDVAGGGGAGGLSSSRLCGLLFGRWLGIKIKVRDLFGLKRNSFGLKNNVELNDWPVVVRLDENGCVDYIRRGGEIEEQPEE